MMSHPQKNTLLKIATSSPLQKFLREYFFLHPKKNNTSFRLRANSDYEIDITWHI